MSSKLVDLVLTRDKILGVRQQRFDSSYQSNLIPVFVTERIYNPLIP
jgi:hypothetical protein